MDRNDMQRMASDALAIQNASNASGVANTLLRHLSTWRDAGGSWNGNDCAAIRFIAFQLAYLTGAGTGADYPGDYSADMHLLQSIADGAVGITTL